ncbi:MAG: uroporphyrin-3 C-methyltransferase, partial [Bacteroidia bacterium]
MAKSDKPADSTETVVTDTPTSASPRKSTTAGGKFTLFLALLAFFLAAASAGWQGYQIWLEQFAAGEQPWAEDITELESRLGTQQRDYQQADAALRDNFGVAQAALVERIQALQGETDSSLTQQLKAITWIKQRQQALDERLQALVKLSREDWILAEADYLMRLAQQRLQLGGNGSDAGPLLQAAQRSLQLVHNKGIEPVREVLAADLAALNEARQFDLAGLDKRVAALAERTQALSPLGDRKLKAAATADPAVSAPVLALDTLWPLIKYGFARAADKLQSYIRISDRDSAYQATVIAGGQRELFQQNV